MLKSSSGARGAGETSTQECAGICSCCQVGVAERGLCLAVRVLTQGVQFSADRVATATGKRSRSGLRAESITASKVGSYTVEIKGMASLCPTVLEVVIRDRLDDARAALVPVINDSQLRGLLTNKEEWRLRRLLFELVELRELYAERVNR